MKDKMYISVRRNAYSLAWSVMKTMSVLVVLQALL